MKKLIAITLSIISVFLLGFVFMNLKNGSKETVTIEAKSFKEVYDGQVHEVSGFLNESEKGIKVSDSTGVTYYVSGVESRYEGKNVSDTTKSIPITGQAVVLNKDGDDVSKRFNVNIKKGSFEITPAKLTLKSKNLSKTYDGLPLRNDNQKLDVEVGWKNGDGATYSFTSSQTEVGSCTNAFEIHVNEGTDLNNYKITKTEGKLTVKKVTKKIGVSIQALGLTCTYDGKEHSVSGFENMDANGRIVFSNNGITYYISGLTSEAKGINVQDSKKNIEIKGSPTIVSEYGQDCTNMFTISMHQASLIIKKAEVILESASISKRYDGMALTNGEYPITEHGFAEKEGASYTFTGTQTEIGSSSNAFDYKLNANTNAENYHITKKEGTLTIESVEYNVTVTGLSYYGVYDGLVHEVNGFENMDEYGNIVCQTRDKTFYISGLVSYCSSKDVCEIQIPVSGSARVFDENGNDYTKYVNINIENGYFIIDPISITLESESASKVYDGQPLSCHELIDDDWNFVGDEGVDVYFLNEITEVGECANAFELIFYPNTSPNNYDITLIYGTLTIEED